MTKVSLSLGYKLQEFRESKNMTLEEIAERSGVDINEISKLEDGSECVVSTKKLKAISNALAATIEQIFFDE